MRKAIARDTILDAATIVAQRDGASRLTIEAVAREVGLSKAGLLYTFPSKDALMSALLERMIDKFSAKVCPSEGRPERGCSDMRAKFDAMLGLMGEDMPLAHAILVAGTHNPALLDPLRSHIAEETREMLEGLSDPVGALVLLSAMDGILLQHLLGLPPTDSELRRQMLERIEVMISEFEVRS